MIMWNLASNRLRLSLSTWTADVEDIVAAHYTDEGAIEFFRQYARNLTGSEHGLNGCL